MPKPSDNCELSQSTPAVGAADATDDLGVPQHVLLIMVDGLGIPPGPLDESVYRHCPALCRLISEHATAVDASLGVPGIPQSATGQTAILTGVNAAQLLGEHLSGFPNGQLRDIIRRENLFSKLMNAGFKGMFANAYARANERRLPHGLQSVTTVATLAAFGRTLSDEHLLAGQAVYHDLTRAWLRQHGRPDVPLISESEAAVHLLQVVRQLDFTLFEFFLTDHAGHRGTEEEQQAVLNSLDRFLAALMEKMDVRRETLILVSDHGNIEAPDRRSHTLNPVPFASYGCCGRRVREGVASILDVTPRILKVLLEKGAIQGKNETASGRHDAPQ